MSALLPKQSIDRRLILAATKIGHTAQDLSDAVNNELSPAQALARVHELLKSMSIYDENDERKLLYIRMGKWLDDLQETHGKNLKAAGAINRAFKLLSDQLNRSQANLDDISTKLGETHAQMFVTAVMRGVEEVVRRMQEESGEILEAEVVQELTMAGADEARKYVATVTSRPAEDQ